ncbi:hypothetical protein [Paenibacillus shenyangensis]|uniref:hypothetical protein n=1 Tax=Paenibacillus sp. A9 TaxID=1284352 RepID=UPI00036BBE97|nr:hypothetical protein [Paenibacillus sp. A9]
MRSKKYVWCWSAMLLSGAMLLGGCDVITSQNITANSGAGMNGNGGGMGMNGGPGRNGGSMRGMMNADVIGKVISVSGNTLHIELMEQSHSDGQPQARTGSTDTDTPAVQGSPADHSSSSAPTTGSNRPSDSSNSPGTDHTDAGNSQQPPGNEGTNLNSTGEKRALQVSEEVQISEGPGMMPQINADPSSASTADPATAANRSELQLSDLQAGETVMIWYKDNTETVDRITVM